MSSTGPTASSQLVKTQRVLACVLCQQRKIKCDRRFPCANCTRSRAQCVPATLTQRRRRRKVPERELLDRIRRYEELLRQNSIPFESLHSEVPDQKEPSNEDGGYDSNEEQQEGLSPGTLSSPATASSKGGYEARNIWHAMTRGFRDPGNESDSSNDDVRETTFQAAWSQATTDEDHLLFGSRGVAVDLFTLHPDPAQIFRLWQTYLDNVNPLLKVTHTPSLQARIIGAAGDVKSIDATLEALLFGIYCMAILSLTEEACQSMFANRKEDLMRRYQFGCQQALSNCGVLRCRDRDCLTALLLYLMSLRRSISPQSLSSMLGVAMRIAQRMGINSESALAKCSAMEAEMRRRVWWVLVLFDTRTSEMAQSKTGMLDPTWDCRIPLNVNDSDLRPEMSKLPSVQGRNTEALFAVVRSELGDFIRHTMFHLDFTNPALKLIAKNVHNDPLPEGGELVKLEQMIEDQYLGTCDRENPLHFMTLWTTRGQLAKFRLLELHTKYDGLSAEQLEEKRDMATFYAIKMLECDTAIMSSALTKGFLWFNQYYFPFPAFAQITQDLRRRPLSKQVRHAWKAMSDNHDAWLHTPDTKFGLFFQIFIRLVLGAWAACETAFQQTGQALTPPTIVTSLRQHQTYATSSTDSTDAGTPNLLMELGLDDFSTPMPMPMSIGFSSQSLPYPAHVPEAYTMLETDTYSGMPQDISQGAPLDPLTWAAAFEGTSDL